MDDEHDGEARSLRELAREVPLSWWLPLPAVLVHALVLLFSRRVWTTLVETSSRSGRSGSIIDAHRYLVFLAVAVGAYVVIGLTGDDGRVMRTSSTLDAAVARVMLRGLCLLVLYGSAFALVRAYVFR